MIKVITYKDIRSSYKLFIGQFRLRHREFLERQQYDVKSIDGLEFDSYDTMASVYLVYSDDGRHVLGCSRLTPIQYGCMLADHFSDLVDDKRIFEARDKIWEGTRFCIDRRLPPQKRQQVCHELVAAYLEFGLARGIDQIIGLMPTIILRTVFEKSGVVLDRLGAVRKVGDHARVQAASISVTEAQLQRVQTIAAQPNQSVQLAPIRCVHVA